MISKNSMCKFVVVKSTLYFFSKGDNRMSLLLEIFMKTKLFIIEYFFNFNKLNDSIMN